MKMDNRNHWSPAALNVPRAWADNYWTWTTVPSPGSLAAAPTGVMRRAPAVRGAARRPWLTPHRRDPPPAYLIRFPYNSNHVH